MPACPAPRVATPRSPDRQTCGREVGRLAAALYRRPLLPWQAQVADVAGELDDDGTFAYPLVLVSVGRRAGKTVLVLATALQRMVRLRRARAWYTAQTRESAARTFREEWTDVLADSMLAGAYHVRRSNGSETITDLVNRSTLSLFTATGLHGADADLGVIDEAWAFDIPTGDALTGALGPAMLTRPNPQTWIISAGGDETSTWWDRELARAEEHVAAGGRRGVALFDWGAAADDAFDDPAVWARSHPAYGLTIDAPRFSAELATHGRAYFERFVLNRWRRPSMLTSVGVVDPAAWSAAVDVDAELAAPVTVAYDIAPDRSSAAVAGAAILADGRTLVSILEHRTGTAWLAERIDGYDPALIVADTLGGAIVANALAARQRPVDLVGGTDLAKACTGFVDAVAAGALAHHGQAPLDDALAGAARRFFGDAWAWSRSRSDVDITPLVAATLALYGATTRIPPPGTIY